MMLALAVAAAVARPPLVVVSLDGYRNEYMDWDKEAGRGFDLVKATGGWAREGMLPPRPSKTFPSHYTMATGLWPEEHGIVGNHMYDPVMDATFSPQDTPGSEGWFLGEPIWETAEKHGVTTGVCYWPGSEAAFDHPPTHLEAYNHTASFEHRLNIIKGWLSLADSPALIMSYFTQPDATGHEYGPNSTEVADIVRSLNPVVESLLQLTQAHGADLVIVSDHGMAGTSNERVIPLEKLVDLSRVEVSGHSPFMSLFVEDRGDIESMYAVLSKQPHLTVYRKPEIPSSWHVGKSGRVGALLLLADDGWSLTTHGEDVCCGTHGYEATAPSQRAIFIAAGPSFRKGSTIRQPFSNIHLYSLMAELLAIEPAPNNSTLDPFKPILKRSPNRGHWNSSVWHPPLNTLTMYPATGSVFPGAHFDVSVTVPRTLPGTHPEEVVLTLNNSKLADMCAEEKALTSSAGYVHHTWRSCSITAHTKLVATSGIRSVSTTLSVKEVRGQGARNVILMVGDGMSLPMLTASRIVARRPHATDEFERSGTCFTKSLESIVTDSAASASALNTGHKTVNGASGVYPDSTPDFTDNPRVETVAEYVRRQFGAKIGVVTTASLVDATPAGVWTHCSSRSQSEVIAQQALGFAPDVLMGGGLSAFGPHETEFTAAGYTIYNKSEDLFKAGQDTKVIGLFADHHLETSKDRQANPENTQPGLPEMATAALDVLWKGGDDRFFLMVEAASIDKMAHACDYTRMISDTLEMQEAIAAVQGWLKQRALAEDTLVLVTSDHATGGFDVYGTVDTDLPEEELPSGIRMYGEAEWPDWEARGGRVVDNWDTAEWTLAGVNVNHPEYKEDFKAKQLDPWWVKREEDLAQLKGLTLTDNIGDSKHHEAHKASVHTASDVMVYATGKGSGLLRAGQENTEVFHILIAAMHPSSPPPYTLDRVTLQIVLICVYIAVVTVLAGVIWYLYARRSKGPSESYTVELSEITQDLEESVAAN